MDLLLVRHDQPLEEVRMKLFVIEESEIERLELMAKRLYTEEQMDGDLMRDFAHTLSAIAKRSREIELPESL